MGLGDLSCPLRVSPVLCYLSAPMSNADAPTLPEPDDEMAPPPGSIEVDRGPPDDPMTFDEPPRREPPGIHRTLVETGRGRVDAEIAERDVRALHSLLTRMRGKLPKGTLEVKRVGPLNLPPQELGVLGSIPISHLRNRLPQDMVGAQWGGGEYEVLVRDASNDVIEGGAFDLQIAGTIRPKSAEGRRYVKEQGEDPDVNDSVSRGVDRMQTMLDQVQQQGGGGNNPAMMLMLAQMREDMAEDRRLREKREREEREEREEKRERDRLEREARDREYREERDERQKRWEAQQKEDAAERQRQHEMNLAHQEQMAARSLEALKLQAGGGSGISAVKRILQEVEEFAGERVGDMLRGPRDPGEGPEDWGGVMRKIAADHGGELLTGVLDLVGDKLGKPRAPRRTAALPAPADEPIEPDVSLDDGAAVAPAGAGDAAGEDEVRVAASPKESFTVMVQHGGAKAQGRVIAFLRLLGSEMMATGDPVEAWEAEQDDAGGTLSSAYLRLPIQLRVAWRRGWREFAQSMPQGAASEVRVISELLKKPIARNWLVAFIDAGPYEDDAAANAAMGEAEDVEETVETEDAPAASEEPPPASAEKDGPAFSDGPSSV